MIIIKNRVSVEKLLGDRDLYLAATQLYNHPRLEWGKAKDGTAVLNCGDHSFEFTDLVDTKECFLEFEKFLKLHCSGVSRYEFTQNVPAAA
ncbi:MAG: hypothetical protein J5934_00035 [Succinivibrio sp.]|nr:hypothetical protein [Succinivibrio sp.]